MHLQLLNELMEVAMRRCVSQRLEESLTGIVGLQDLKVKAKKNKIIELLRECNSH